MGRGPAGRRLPGIVAAPRGGPPRRWGGSACPSSSPRARPRALSAVVLAAARLPRAAFLRPAGGFRAVAAGGGSRVAVLGRARPSPPRARLPPAAARCGGPVLALRAPPVRCGLRSAAGPPVALSPLRAPAGRPPLWSGSLLGRCGSGGASLPRRGCRAPRLRGGSSPRGGSRPAARASGGRVPRPRAGGCLGLAGAAARLPSVKAKASGPRCGPALTAGAAVGVVWARAFGPILQAGA